MNALGAFQVAYSTTGESITAEDIGCAGAMTVLMKDAIEPTLMQTLEGTPVLVHAGPFGNIAHGNSSIVADRIALKLVGKDGFVLTEAGFGADMGCEKFFDIKCRTSGLTPDGSVIVATVRALKFHGGVDPSKASEPNDAALRQGCANLIRHVRNINKYHVPVVVALNRFKTDTDADLAMVRDLCLKEAGAFDVVVSTHWAEGGRGAVGVAEALTRACSAQRLPFNLLYPNDMTLIRKIETIAREIYGAERVELLNDSAKKLGGL